MTYVMLDEAQARDGVGQHLRGLGVAGRGELRELGGEALYDGGALCQRKCQRRAEVGR